MNSEADVSGAPLIAVATCTFRRPEGLRRLYEGLAAMDLPSDVSLALITIDNAGDVELPSFEGDWPSVIEVEHERGIGRSGRGFTGACARATAGQHQGSQQRERKQEQEALCEHENSSW